MRNLPGSTGGGLPARHCAAGLLVALLWATVAVAEDLDPRKVAAMQRGEVPGRAPATEEDVARIFRQACIASAGDLGHAEANMVAAGLIYRAPTGTRYHKDFNLSVRIVPGEARPRACSMVIVTDVPTLAMMMLAASLNIVDAPDGFHVEANESEPGVFHFVMRR